MTKEDIKQLVYDIRFECSEEEINDIYKTLLMLEKRIDTFKNINTEGVEEMVYPLPTITTYLREDVVDNVKSRADILKNASKTINGHVIVPKVVR